MNKTKYFVISIQFFLLAALLLSGCGGTKMLKEPQPIQAVQPLAAASDHRLTATVDWVIVRDGPGTWARNADWDEYLVRVHNKSDQPIRVVSLTVVDSLDTRVESLAGRKLLVKASKQTAKRYKKSGIKVKAGRGAAAMLAAGAAVTVVGVGAGTAAAYGSIYGAGAGGAAAAASGLLLLGPALAVGGIVRGVRNGEVNKQIEARSTPFPFDIAPGEEVAVDIFYPLAPSPQSVDVNYTDADGANSLIVDTHVALDGLHFNSPKK